MSVPTSLNASLKAELWRRFGTHEYPAEWDGIVHGGGKLSQRFWEYFKAIELLDLDSDSVVLDIGGGSPETGLGFFSSILATRVKKLVVMDPSVSLDRPGNAGVEFVPRLATYPDLSAVLRERPELTHVCSISVFEHIEPEARQGITRAINEHFQGRCFVSTFEYHSLHPFFDHQLTARTASDLFRPLDRFYLDRMEASPVWAENAFDPEPKFTLRKRRFFWQRPRLTPTFTPRWYPLAVRFLKVGE